MSNTSRFATIILLAALTLLVGRIIYIEAAAVPSFDGAMNLDVARSIAHGEGYRRNYASREPFPHEIQTGIPFILPAALVYKLVGVGVIQSQIVNILYFALLLVVAYRLVDRSSPRWTAALGALAVAATPGVSTFGFSGYGEIPALALFLAATLLYFNESKREERQSAILSGGLIGAAILTKTVMLIGAGALGLVALLSIINNGRRAAKYEVWRLATFVATAVGVVVIAETWRAGSLGGSRPWLNWWKSEAGSIFMQAGVEPTKPHSAHFATKFITHLELLSHDFKLSTWIVAAWLILSALMLVLTLCTKQKSPAVLRTSVILLAGIVYLGWWLLLTPTSKAWHRRILNGMICADLGLVMATARYVALLGTQSIKGFYKHVTRVYGIFVVVTCLVLTIKSSRDAIKSHVDPEGTAELMRTAAQVKNLPQSAYVFGIGWYSAPRVTLFSGRHILDFNDTPIPRMDETKSVYFIDGPLAPMSVWDSVESTYGVQRTPKRDFALIGPYRLQPKPLTPTGTPVERSISASANYPYMRGFNQPEGANGRWLTSDNVILLTPHEGDRFALQAYALRQDAYLYAPPVAVTVSFNNCPAPGPQVIQSRTSTTLYFPIPEVCHIEAEKPVNVRIQVNNLTNTAVTTDPRPLSLLSHFLGFVDGDRKLP